MRVRLMTLQLIAPTEQLVKLISVVTDLRHSLNAFAQYSYRRLKALQPEIADISTDIAGFGTDADSIKANHSNTQAMPAGRIFEAAA